MNEDEMMPIISPILTSSSSMGRPPCLMQVYINLMTPLNENGPKLLVSYTACPSKASAPEAGRPVAHPA